MDTAKLKKFAQAARRDLLQQVGGKLTQVLDADGAARREQAAAVAELEGQVKAHGREAVVERAAYTWFNRLTALRFMDANGYNRIMAVSPAKDESQPEILAEAKSGHIDEQNVPQKVREQVFALLDGRAPSRDPQAEAYRLLLVAVCNYWHQAMPFLFERISDWTELLMPDDLLSDTAVRTRIRSVLTAEDCQDVEVIGWLYQFYISEKKDEVFAGLKKGKKISAENIPAATQLFTPHWIVRYLVENSLGRLWLLNRPNSHLAERMDYYIAPEEPENNFLRIDKPEDIKLCDPACGSGHMLTYAFDLLYAIYEEEGYAPDDIPALILAHNLTGIEIDERAGALAAFALAMKAAEKLGRRKFLKMETQPNIVVLQDVRFTEEELKEYMAEVGRDLFTADLRETLGQFEQAKNFGSLIQPAVKEPTELRCALSSRSFEGNLFLSETHKRALNVLRMAEALLPKYHVVVANPPYASATGLNTALRDYSEMHFRHSKNDLYSMFMERNGRLAKKAGYVSMIAMQSWMYLKTFWEVRQLILKKKSLLSLLHLGPHAFPEIQGERVQAASFIYRNENPASDHAPIFFRLISGKGEDKELAFLARSNEFSSVKQSEFLRLPDLSIAYKMLSNPVLKQKLLAGDMVTIDARIGSQPGSDLIILWWEIIGSQIGGRWRRYNKGGTFRRWFGNAVWVLNYGQDGEKVTEAGGQLSNQDFYGKPHISWTRVSARMNLRFYDEGTYFDNTAPAIFEDLDFLQGYLNSKVGEFNRTGKFSGTKIEAGHVQSIAPVSPTTEHRSQVEDLVSRLIQHSSSDWDAIETSWDFTTLTCRISSDHFKLGRWTPLVLMKWCS